MADFRPYDSRVNLPAIFIGALVAFTANVIFFTFGAGLDMGAASLGFMIGFSPMAKFLFFAISTFAASATGGYIGGYYSSSRNLMDARLHGFAAVALASLLLTIALFNSGNIVLRSFINGTPMPAPTALVQPNPAVPNLAVRAPGAARPSAAFARPRARVFVLRSLLGLEAVLVSAWAGGMAISRARRGTVELTGEETRAA